MGAYITFKAGPDEWSEKLDLNEDQALAIEAAKVPERLGEWVTISEVDARELGSIKTDNLGTVKIRKRAVPNTILRLLRGTRKRLAACGADAMVDITVG